MKGSITHQILKEHLVSGTLEPGEEIGIRIDQTLTQDATGTMAYLQLEAMEIDRVATELSVSYVDHNTLQNSYENADDHRYLQTVAARHGVYFSRPGNGICHQVHLERFGAPGKTLLGSDSHTPTAGGLGMLAIGAGGLDVAVAMAGEPFYLEVPRVIKVELSGELPPWVGAKDVILELLRRLTVKGGLNTIFEYGGEGVKSLSIPQRATIANMGAELGATTSLFPSDQATKDFLQAQGRGDSWQELEATPDAHYHEVIKVDLNQLEPLAACPHSPDRVKPVQKLGEVRVNQVALGSCTNSSYSDLVLAAEVLKGKTVHPDVNLVVAPGSRQVLEMLARQGALANLINAGARILENACGPCIGMGQAPPTGSASLRTFNRNFPGRSGTPDAEVFLAGPETAAATALQGVISDPRNLGSPPPVQEPGEYLIDDNMVIPPLPPAETKKVTVVRGPNIQPLPSFSPLPYNLEGEILLKVEDHITTDHIMPAGAKVLPLRSNIPAISQYVFHQIDSEFPYQAEAKGGGLVVGGDNYGQGSSREHAALAPRYLGLKAVLARSFARIHHSNLVNFGILPLVFFREEDYEKVDSGDYLVIPHLHRRLDNPEKTLPVHNRTKGEDLTVKHQLSTRQIEIVKAGGLLNYVRDKKKKEYGEK